MTTKTVLASLAATALAVATAQAQTNVRIRGTITAVNATSMSVKSRDGRDLQITLPDNATVAVAKAVKFEEIKDGDFVGTTTKPGPGGTEVAMEVHYLPPTAAGQTRVGPAAQLEDDQCQRAGRRSSEPATTS